MKSTAVSKLTVPADRKGPRWWGVPPQRAGILAFGAHPDDVEIHAGGTLAKYARMGRAVVVVDATEGDLATNGSPVESRRECARASRLLGLAARANLGFPDGGLGQDEDLVPRIVDLLRQLRPRVVLASTTSTRHPDHAALGNAVREALFFMALPRYRTAHAAAPRPEAFYQYLEVSEVAPTLLVDVSATYSLKCRAIASYTSQFAGGHGRKRTFINSGFLELLQDRNRRFGLLAGVRHAEPFLADHPPLVDILAAKTPSSHSSKGKS